MAKFWICPKCGQRCLARNEEAHKKSDFCRLRCTVKARHEAGFAKCMAQWKAILKDAGVPFERDIVRMNGIGKKYEQKAIVGLWAPRWACRLLGTTKNGNCGRNLRVLILHHLQHNPEFLMCIDAAERLTDWSTAYALVYEEIRNKYPSRRRKSE
jgi:hypothetical protein